VIGLRRGLVRGARISALGVHVPERVLTNDEISQFLDTSDEWILTRTGIRERRIARVDEAASDLGEIAARRCLESGLLDPTELDLVIVTTISPDHMMPATASIVADKIGATKAGARLLEFAAEKHAPVVTTCVLCRDNLHSAARELKIDVPVHFWPEFFRAEEHVSEERTDD